MSRDGVCVSSPPRADHALSVVEVRETTCVLSTGEVLLVKWAKLRALLEQLCQEQAVIGIRTWWTPDGDELIDVRRVGGRRIEFSMEPMSKPSTDEAF